MEKNYKFVIAYDGIRFFGWEHQPDKETIQGKLEAVLERLQGRPVDLIGAGRTDAGVHARYNALGKTYRYTCFIGPVKPVFDRKYVTLLDFSPDIAKMRRAAEILQGEHDFRAFCGNPRMKKSTVRLVDTIQIEERKDRILFTFHGTGFLQNMVRILVGTLLEVGRGRWEPEYVQEILDGKDRKLAGPTAPPEGLCLMKVDY